MARIVLATGNQGKLKEIRSLFVNTDHQIVAQSGFGFAEAIEDGQSFVENAIIKARHAARQTGCAALADDSGLAVDALAGEPGIYSARYAGPNATDSENRKKLLSILRGIENRAARFHCVMVYMKHAADPGPLITHGVWSGEVAQQETGQGGFGYDSIFFVPGEQCTAAQLTPERKNALSHRGNALRALRQQLEDKT